MLVLRTQSLDTMVIRTLVLDIRNLVSVTMQHHHDDGVLPMVRNHHEQHDCHRLKKRGNLTNVEQLTFFFRN